MARVGDIMKRQIVSIAAGDCLSTVDDIMTLGGVRHMPVVSGGSLVGVLSERDLLRASISNLERAGVGHRRAFLNAVEISDVMSSPPVVIDQKASISDAARVMAEHKIGCLPAVDERGLLVGIVTETDLLLYFAEHAVVPL